MEFFDTRIAEKLLNYSDCSLKGSASQLFNETFESYADAKTQGPERFREYALRDAYLTTRVGAVVWGQIDSQGLRELNDIEQQFGIVSFECEHNGIAIADDKLIATVEDLGLKKRELTGILNEGFEAPVNWNSPRQVTHALVFGCKTPLVIHKGKPSTAAASLKKIRNNHPKIDMLLELKKVEASLRLIKKLRKFIDPATGRLYPYYDTLGADTGRATSKNPNLQNVPKGDGLRLAFRASAGHKIIRIDFSQIEPRVLAHFLPGSDFAELFLTEGDYYEKIGGPLFDGIAMNISNRDASKGFQLSLLYGAGESSLSDRLGVDAKTGAMVMSRFRQRFPEVELFRQAVLNDTRETGFATGLLNRRRFIPDINSTSPGLRFRAERQAFNAVIQGSAATMFKHKAVALRKVLPLEVRFLLHIHDELVLEAPVAFAQETLDAAITVLEKPVPWFTVPIRVDGGVGDSWLEAKTNGGAN